MNNQAIYRTSAIRGSMIGVGIAFIVILLATQSIITSTLACISICSVLVSMIGLMVMMGWSLGTIQSILISILAGFSVDFVVHLAHAYCHSRGTRDMRTTAALAEMGSPVLRESHISPVIDSHILSLFGHC